MARASGWTVKAGLNNKEYQASLREMGVQTRQAADTGAQGFVKMTVAIAAATAAVVKLGKDSVVVFKDVEAEILNIQYAIEDMGASGREQIRLQVQEIPRPYSQPRSAPTPKTCSAKNQLL